MAVDANTNFHIKYFFHTDIGLKWFGQIRMNTNEMCFMDPINICMSKDTAYICVDWNECQGPNKKPLPC